MDLLSYILGRLKGQRESQSVEIESDSYEFSDPNSDGNIVITAAQEEESEE